MKIILVDNRIPRIKNNDEYAICLGVFDGVHMGHRKLMEMTIKLAKERGLKAGVLSFYSNDFKNKISTLEQNAKYIEQLGFDTLFLYNFNLELKNKSYLEFLEQELVNYIKAKEIICGFNYTFGKDKKGTVETLVDYQQQYGYNLTKILPISHNETVVSSTFIRTLLKNGEIKQANYYLKRPYEINGVVEKGNMIGRTMNFPTANISLPTELLTLKKGVYSSKTKIGDKIYNSITNIGTAPTFKEKKCISETFILDYNKEIYNENITVYLYDFLREEMKFNSLDELKKTIKNDIKRRMDDEFLLSY